MYSNLLFEALIFHTLCSSVQGDSKQQNRRSAVPFPSRNLHINYINLTVAFDTGSEEMMALVGSSFVPSV